MGCGAGAKPASAEKAVPLEVQIARDAIEAATGKGGGSTEAQEKAREAKRLKDIENGDGGLRHAATSPALKLEFCGGCGMRLKERANNENIKDQETTQCQKCRTAGIMMSGEKLVTTEPDKTLKPGLPGASAPSWHNKAGPRVPMNEVLAGTADMSPEQKLLNASKSLKMLSASKGDPKGGKPGSKSERALPKQGKQPDVQSEVVRLGLPLNPTALPRKEDKGSNFKG